MQVYPGKIHPQPQHGEPVEIVLGAGGIKGFGHIGLLKAIEEYGINIGKITGVSVGSLVAALYTNGFSPDDLLELFLERLGHRLDPALLARALTIPDPLSFLVGGCLDLRPAYEELVAKHGLAPNHRLRIVSYDCLGHHPVVFQGSNYKLSHALAASGAVPGVFRPIWQAGDNGGWALLVDGALYHYNPTEFCRGRAIVGRFSQATELPTEWQLPLDLYFHFREMYLPLAGNRRYVDPAAHVVIDIGLPDVAGLNFGISRRKCLALVQDGYEKACASLDQALEQGRL
jgi:hypothetical protein